jgi:hypothetical protein
MSSLGIGNTCHHLLQFLQKNDRDKIYYLLYDVALREFWNGILDPNMHLCIILIILTEIK